MSSSSPGAPIVVLGAGGVVGRRICVELARMAAEPDAAPSPLVIAGRRGAPLAELAQTLPVAGLHVAEADDPAALARAFAGARVVINAAGPLRDTAGPVLEAALAAGAHYVDIGGEQAALQALYERHESAVRKAGLIALPGAGVDCLLGDLGAAWAAAYVIGEAAEPASLTSPPGHAGHAGHAGHMDPAGRTEPASRTDPARLASAPASDAVRTAPAPRLADDRPLDDIAVSYVFDQLALSAGSQRALFGALGSRAQLWRRDRWEPGPAGEHRRVNAGPALGGERDAQAFAGGDPITIPRHVAAHRVASYLSTTRRAGAATALRLLSRALPFVPHHASALLVPYAEPGADYGRTRFAIVAQARRGFAAAQITISGHDLYRTTAAIAAWSARRLAARGTGPLGMRAPGELFHAEPALHALARCAELAIEPSFG